MLHPHETYHRLDSVIVMILGLNLLFCTAMKDAMLLGLSCIAPFNSQAMTLEGSRE